MSHRWRCPERARSVLGDVQLLRRSQRHVAQETDAVKEIQAGVLNVEYLDVGPSDGPAAVLLHGFPYDVHAYDEVADLLAAAGCRCIIPYL